MNIKQLHNEPLAKHTTFRIGGPAKLLVVPYNKIALIKLVMFCIKKRVPHYLLGKGSNVLMPSSGLNSVVIKNTQACKELRIGYQR